MNPLCNDCRVPLATYSTRVVASSRIRYLRCPQCGARPADNIAVVPLAHAPRRGSKSVLVTGISAAPCPIASASN
jgi:hypothetical protein